ncbi:MAG: hypothetical protein M1360_00530 [Candidatus Marsarchaeota archaeon]|jgi:predicted PurR-regulated permease PerM|nr:hypothetical protein [Candidatus Marsarchaeota archaeon]MCL5418411.1 hypothetical protein [Candidatus Marsarchaeota archaeon]
MPTKKTDTRGTHGKKVTNNIKRAAKMQKLLEHIAYYSLFIDFAITAVTLISINMHKPLESITFYLNLALSVVVVVSMVLFAVIFFLSHYDKILDRFALMYARKTEKEEKP